MLWQNCLFRKECFGMCAVNAKQQKIAHNLQLNGSLFCPAGNNESRDAV